MGRVPDEEVTAAFMSGVGQSADFQEAKENRISVDCWTNEKGPNIYQRLLKYLFINFDKIKNDGRCGSECETGDLPSQQICDEFFERVGGRKLFKEANLGGAKITMNGEQHECSTEEGPGEFGWCKVGARFTIVTTPTTTKHNKTKYFGFDFVFERGVFSCDEQHKK